MQKLAFVVLSLGFKSDWKFCSSNFEARIIMGLLVEKIWRQPINCWLAGKRRSSVVGVFTALQFRALVSYFTSSIRSEASTSFIKSWSCSQSFERSYFYHDFANIIICFKNELAKAFSQFSAVFLESEITNYSAMWLICDWKFIYRRNKFRQLLPVLPVQKFESICASHHDKQPTEKITISFVVVIGFFLSKRSTFILLLILNCSNTSCLNPAIFSLLAWISLVWGATKRAPFSLIFFYNQKQRKIQLFEIPTVILNCPKASGVITFNSRKLSLLAIVAANEELLVQAHQPFPWMRSDNFKKVSFAFSLSKFQIELKAVIDIFCHWFAI